MPPRIRMHFLLLLFPTLALGAENPKALLRQKLEKIIIPKVQFHDASLEQTLEYFRSRSRELDKSPDSSGEKGVKIILRLGDTPNTATINLDVKDLPLSEALRYVTELSETKFRVEADSVLIVPLSAEFETEIHTRTFKVPPDFLSNYNPSYGSQAASPDPFASLALDAQGPFQPVTARQTLEAAGVHFFSKGTSASFNRLTGLLTVTNTQPNLDLVEGYVDSIHRQAAANVAFTLTVIEGPGELIRQSGAAASKSADAFKELSALLEQANTPGSNVRVVSDAFLEAKSGARSTAETVHEHTPATPIRLEPGTTNSTKPKPLKNGLLLEIEPLINDGSSTIAASLKLELSVPPATPQQTGENIPAADPTPGSSLPEISGMQIHTNAVIQDGGTQLIGITGPVAKPQENADTLCAVFLTATLRRVEALPPPQPKAASHASLPPGMIFTALVAPEGMFDEFLPTNPPLTLQAWLAEKGITFAPGSSIEHRDGQLSLINTPDNISSIATILDQLLKFSPKNIACTVHTIEAPAPFLRDLARQTLPSADDTAMFAALQSAVSRGEASFIDSAFLQTTSGTLSTHQAAREHATIKDLGTAPQDRRNLSFETRPAGSLFEIQPVVGADSHTIHVTYEHALHPAVPALHPGPASPQPSTALAPDFHFHKTSTTSSLTDGSIKLISLTSPPGPEKTGRLWATFLKCDLVHVLARHTKATSPQASRSPSPQIAASMQVRQFGGQTPSNGSALIPARQKTDEETQEFLEIHGVSFPTGAYVRHLGYSRGIIVRNTPSNLARVRAIFGGESPPRSAVITTHVFQASGQLLRRLTAQATLKSDHIAELNELLATVKAGSAKCLGTARIETQSDIRSTIQQGMEHPTLTDAHISKGEAPELITENRNIGFSLEVTPDFRAGSTTVDLNISPEFHTGPPTHHREHITDPQGRRLEFPLTDYFTSKLTTAITIPDGTARLISLYKPTGKPEFEKDDILQAIFITCDILRAEK